MTLDDVQQKRVRGWIEEGLKVSDIQLKIASELGVQMTYMDVRFLLDDLKLRPKDIERAPAPALPPEEPKAPKPGKASASPLAPGAPAATSAVTLTVDQVARPGALVSGTVTFSDGQDADWSLDQMGRLALGPKKQGYKPSQQDLVEFQAQLQNELARFGY